MWPRRTGRPDRTDLTDRPDGDPIDLTTPAADDHPGYRMTPPTVAEALALALAPRPARRRASRVPQP